MNKFIPISLFIIISNSSAMSCEGCLTPLPPVCNLSNNLPYNVVKYCNDRFTDSQLIDRCFQIARVECEAKLDPRVIENRQRFIVNCLPTALLRYGIK